jgi:hypothetical protein
MEESTAASVTKGIFTKVELSMPQATLKSAKAQESMSQIQQVRAKEQRRVLELAEQNAKLQQVSMERTMASKTAVQEKRDAAMRQMQAGKEAIEQQNELKRLESEENVRQYRESRNQATEPSSSSMNVPRTDASPSPLDYVSKAWERESKYMK